MVLPKRFIGVFPKDGRAPLAQAGRLIRRFFFFAAAAAGTALLVATFTPAVPWAVSFLARPWDDGAGDVLVLLSGGTVASAGPPARALPGEDSCWRTIHAAHVWHGGRFRYLVVSGLESAGAIKPLLVAYGVPEGAILVENRAATTRENVLFLKPILTRLGGRNVLVTSDYHTYRATRCFRREGVPVTTRPAPDLGKRAHSLPARWPAAWELLTEAGKIVHYRLKGWI